MPDIFTKRKRSDVMARIRSAGNKATELRLVQSSGRTASPADGEELRSSGKLKEKS